MRTKNAVYNLIFSLIRQVVSILFNLVIPILIIRTFGSDLNGMVSSITKFLSYIAIAEGGLGGVVKAGFIKSIADNNNDKINKIYSAINKFFKYIALVYLGYVIILCIFYPLLLYDSLDKIPTILLIVSIALINLSKYLFGLSSQLLIESYQKNYIVEMIKILILVISGIVMAILINNNVSLILVELSYAVVNSIGAISIYYIQNKLYPTLKVKSSIKCIEERWSGLGIQVASFIHDNIDIFLITIFCSLSEVSVYSVYLLVALGLRNILSSFLSSVTSGFGDILARKKYEQAKLNFECVNTMFIILVSIIFSTAIILIIPFVEIYTNDITDANYIRPIFSVIYLIAEMIFLYRTSYTLLPFSIGKYKDVRLGAYCETIINILISIILINYYGIIGVAIGTLASMLFRQIYQMKYLHNNLIYLGNKYNLLNIITNLGTVIIIGIINYLFNDLNINSYGKWVLYGFIVIIIVSIIFLLVNLIFNKKSLINSIKFFRKKIFGKL